MAKATIQNLNEQPVNERDNTHIVVRLLYYLNPLDGRYDDLGKGNWKLNVMRDFTAGQIVAMFWNAGTVPRAIAARRTHWSAACLRARYCAGVSMLLGLI